MSPTKYEYAPVDLDTGNTYSNSISLIWWIVIVYLQFVKIIMVSIQITLEKIEKVSPEEAGRGGERCWTDNK